MVSALQNSTHVKRYFNYTENCIIGTKLTFYITIIVLKANIIHIFCTIAKRSHCGISTRFFVYHGNNKFLPLRGAPVVHVSRFPKILAKSWRNSVGEVKSLAT